MPKFDAGMEGMLDTFMFETNELLENLDDILIRTEQVQDISQISDDDINEIFRTMHTIKGSASMMGLANMSGLAHAVEDLFYIIREKSYVRMDKPALFGLLFQSSDSLKAELENLSDDDIPLSDLSPLEDKLHEMAGFLKGEGGTGGKKADIGEIFDENEPEDMLTYKVVYSEKCKMPSARAMVLINKLGIAAEVCRTIPEDLDDDSADDMISSGGLYIKLITDDKEAVEKVLSAGLDIEGFEAVTKAENSKPTESSADGGTITYRVKFRKECEMPSARAMTLLRKLKASAGVKSTVPDDLDEDGADDKIKKDGLLITLVTADMQAVEAVLGGGIDVESAVREDKASDRAKDGDTGEIQNAAANVKAAQKHEKKEQSMLTVRLEKLDRLLDLVSEIAIAQGAVTSSPDILGFSGNLENFNKSTRELKKLTDELQDVVMSIRMVPVSTAFQKMNRVVRDMNSTLGKNVTLIFKGQETEVDKSIIDILGDPLMHIVRNAVDHGIETPEERAASGKNEPPAVTLSAGYDSSEVVISCSDNGAGMDSSKIMAKAKRNGLLTKPENEYTDKEIFNFILAPGFSTNEQVTQYSGRGVGMDVVKKNLEKVGGKLTVTSRPGKGSKFTIRIPLSLSIIDVLSVQVGTSSLSIPALSVREAFSCKREDYITDPEGNEFIYLREKCLRVIKLSQAFRLETECQLPDQCIFIYVKEGNKEGVLMADSLICDQQVVVKPFSPLLDDLKLKEAGLSGCSVLGDGSITMILDVRALLSSGETGEEEHING